MSRPPAQSLVLIGFAEALAAVEAAWSLQAAGFRVASFRRRGTRPALRRVRDVDVYDVPAPEQDFEATIAGMRGLVQRLQPCVLLPLDDHSLWLCRSGGDWGVPIAGASGSAIDCALDKSMQLAAAEHAGLRVPPTQVVDDLSAADASGHAVMIKPSHPVHDEGGRLVRPAGVIAADAAEVAQAAKKHWHGDLVIQPLIRGVGEGLFGHRGQNGVTAWSAHRRVRMVNPAGSASSACRSIEVDPTLAEASERFLTAIDWRGMFMLEFLRGEDGTPWFMELNGRAWGSMALARRRGFEYPAWTVASTLDPGFAPIVPVDPPQIVCRNLGLELVRLLFVIRGPRSRASIQWPTLREAWRDLVRRGTEDRFYNWNRHQPQVLLADTIGTVGTYLRKLTGKRS